MEDGKVTSCVEQIPDVSYIRRELARNQRERSLLQRLLKLAERKASISSLNDKAESAVSHD